MPSADLTRCRNRRWQRCTVDQWVLGWSAAGFRQTRKIQLHLLLFLERVHRSPEDLRGPEVRRHDHAIVHPLALAPRFHNFGASQVRQMPRNLWLWPSEDFHEVADTYLLVSHEVEKPKPSVVPESLEEAFEIVGLLACHVFMYTH